MLINSMAIQTSAIDMSSFNVDVQKYCVTIISKVNKASRCNQIMPTVIYLRVYLTLKLYCRITKAVTAEILRATTYKLIAKITYILARLDGSNHFFILYQ